MTGYQLSAISYRLLAISLLTTHDSRLTTHDLPTPDSRLRQIHEPGQAAGFVREGEGGACAALHGLWERASFSAGAMLSAWLTSRSGARIHRSVASATDRPVSQQRALAVRIGDRGRDSHATRSIRAFQQPH